MSPEEKKEGTERAENLRPGDLILVRTPSLIYSAFRKMGNQKYDHIVN